MPRYISAILAAAFLAGCATPSTSIPNPPTPAPYEGPPWLRYEASTEEIGRAELIVRGALKDPESARFRSFQKVSRGMGDDYICGEVNAKNSYGGYTGHSAFTVSSAGKVKFATKDDIDGLLVMSICSKPLAQQNVAN